MMMVNLLSRSEDSICFNRFCAGLKAQGLGFVDAVFPQVGWVFGCLFQVGRPREKRNIRLSKPER